uniref:Methyltransferase domain-containing protein n=1 Tax=viral metagenome TaxID=1070528 RepID=A0A6C0AQI2_9ZZZZ
MINEGFDPGYFYSVIPNITKDYNNTSTKFIDISFNDDKHIEILNEIPNYLTKFDSTFGIANNSELQANVARRQQELQYTIPNEAFEWMDGRLLHYYLQKNKPKKIIEIGCGNSTLLTYNTKEMFNLDVEITCIEPYPTDYLVKLHDEGKINLIKDKLENIDLQMFKNLNEHDILFIDSSHVLKLDSDVMYYFTKILPLLKKNVLVHIHDIFFPYDYPLDWLKEGRFWNEQYFLYVFLQFNTKFKIQFSNSYALFKFHDKLKAIQKDSYEIVNNITKGVFGGGSMWMLVTE